MIDYPNIEAAYINLTKLTKAMENMALSMKVGKSDTYASLLEALIQSILNIPSTAYFQIIPLSDGSSFQFILTNDYSKISLWNCIYKDEVIPFFQVNVQIIANGNTKHFSQRFSLIEPLNLTLRKELALSFKMDTGIPLFKNIAFDSDFEELYLNKNKYETFTLFNNSDLKNRDDFSFVKIDEYYLFTFHYYDGPLSGIHIIDGKFYHFSHFDFIYCWQTSPCACKFTEVSPKYASYLSSLVEKYKNNIDEYNKVYKLNPFHSYSKIDPNILFHDNPEKKKEMEDILEELSDENTAIFEKDRDTDLLPLLITH